MTFEQWKTAVDVVLMAKIGLMQEDLPDWLARDAFEDGLTPDEAAQECLEEAGWYDDKDAETDDGYALASAGFGTDEDYGG
jgi:hypothetical protein